MNQEASFTFTTPLNVNLVEIKGIEHLFVEGDISTNDIDLVDDIMTKGCQESMQRQVMERSMKLDIEHEAFKGKTHEEKEINKTRIRASKLTDATVKDLGKGRYSTRVKGEINIHNPDYKNIKGNLIDGYLDAFSVAFLPVDVKTEERDGEQVQLLNDVKLLNVALTGNPCNTKAQLTDIVQKSMDAVEEYKKMKEEDPDIEKRLVVKNKELKENPLSFIWNKIMSGKVLDKKEMKLLKAAIDVTDNKGTEAQLAKEYFDKVSNGLKLTWKEYYVFKELISIEYQLEDMPEMAKSNSPDVVGKTKLNKPKILKKMTEDKDKKPEGEGNDPEGEESDVEQKAMLKDLGEGMKSLAEKYEAVAKENVDLKESVGKIAEAIEKITKALENPIHKSPGAQKTPEQLKAEADTKSVNPLDLFK